MTGDVPADVRPGSARRGRRPRGRAGAVTARVLLAIATSTVVTFAVAGPMAYQAHQARTTVDVDEPAMGRPTASTTTTTKPAEQPASVAGATTVPSGSELAGPTTAAPTTSTPRRTTTTSVGRPQSPATTVAPSPTTAAPAQSGSPSPTLSTPGGTVPPAPEPTTTAVPTTLPPPSPGDLVWTASGRVDPLDGEALQGVVLPRDRVWIYFRGRGAVAVVFRLDDESAGGDPFHTDTAWPFSLVAGPTEQVGGWLDTRTLGGGTHSVRADVLFAGGDTAVRLAYFTVED